MAPGKEKRRKDVISEERAVERMVVRDDDFFDSSRDFDSYESFVVVLPPGSDAFDEHELAIRCQWFYVLFIMDILLILYDLFTQSPFVDMTPSLMCFVFMAVNACGLFGIQKQNARLITIYIGMVLFELLYLMIYHLSYLVLIRSAVIFGLLWTSLAVRSILQYTWYQTFR